MSKLVNRSKNYYGKEIFYFKKTFNKSSPFCIELAGETFPNSKYHITIWPSDAYVLEYIISGKGTLLLDNIKYPIKAGDFCIITSKKSCEYYADPKDPYHKIWINCNGTFINNLCRGFKLDLPFIVQPLPIAEDYIRSIHNILSITGISISKREKECAAILTRLLFSLYEQKFSSEINKKNKIIDDAINYINEHICEPINLKEVEKEIFISHTHLNRLFLESFNMSPHQYITHQRIELACTMLEKTALSISAIASHLSFSDPHYFSYAFKKETGYTPTEYRSAMHQHPPSSAELSAATSK